MSEQDKTKVQANQSVADMEAEIKKAELELKKLEIKRATADLQDIEERLAERQMIRTTKSQRSKGNGEVLRQNDVRLSAIQSNCNHKKGGTGAEGLINGQGDDSQYAVFKHKFAHGDTWVRCLRCGKTWKPPVELSFYFNDAGVVVSKEDGKFNKEKFEAAVKEYREALVFTTKNIPSSGYTFEFTSTDPVNVDAKTWVREQLVNTTLR